MVYVIYLFFLWVAVRCWVLIVGLLEAVCILLNYILPLKQRNQMKLDLWSWPSFRVAKDDWQLVKRVCVILLLIRKDDLVTHHSKIWALIHVHYSILGFCSVCFRMSIWRSFHFPNKDLELFAFSRQMVQFLMLRFDSLILLEVLWHMRCGPFLSLFS